jgi:NAD(P)-dependent dehydrogenase (short-subunit alcohol dehydrogenase family)
LDGKVAIITGAGRAIGRGEAILLAREGASVVVNDIVKENAEAVVAEIRGADGEAVANAEAVGDMDVAERMVDQAVRTFGRLDILVNNAGNQAVNPVDLMTEEQWDAVQKVHLRGTFSLIRYAVPVFKRQRAGVIVNTSSEAGLGRPIAPSYCAAKEGIVGLTRAVAREQGRFGIRCNAIRPRAAETGLTKIFMENMQKWIPLIQGLGRYFLGERGHVRTEAKADQVAPIVVWLCTDAAANVNGRTFYIGGDEVGLWSEPELIRCAMRPGGWDLDSLDELASNYLTFDLANHFLLKDSIGDREL